MITREVPSLRKIETLQIITTKQVVIDHAATGRAVAQFRDDTGIAQKALALEMNIMQSYLSDLEHGRRDWSESIFRNAKEALGRLLKP